MRKLNQLMVGAAISLGACGVPLDSRPEKIPGQQLPPDLQAPPSTPPSTVVRTGHAATVQLYFMRGDRLAAVARQIPGPPTLAGVLDEVLAGPAQADEVGGIRSAISPGTRIRRALLADGVADVDLSEPFVDVQGEEQIAAIAQLVFSCTALPGVERVQLRLEGLPVEVPAGDGTLTVRPLSRTDFPGLAPP
jgi:spore germination protein GerM